MSTERSDAGGAEPADDPGGPVRLVIVVVRSGGFAGLTRRWRVEAVADEQLAAWRPLIESCPWDDVADDPAPDRFVYRISAGEHEATLPERRLEGPWRALVDRVRDEGVEVPAGRRPAP